MHFFSSSLSSSSTAAAAAAIAGSSTSTNSSSGGTHHNISSSIIGFLAKQQQPSSSSTSSTRGNSHYYHSNWYNSSNSWYSLSTKRRLVLGFAACMLLISLWGPGSIVVGRSTTSSNKGQTIQWQQKQQLLRRQPRKEEEQESEVQEEVRTPSMASTSTSSFEGQSQPEQLLLQQQQQQQLQAAEETEQKSSSLPLGPDQPVSSKLECRASVLEFVINASDQKDECDGLRRAFVTACTNLDMAGQIFTSSTTAAAAESTAATTTNDNNINNNNNNLIQISTNTQEDNTNNVIQSNTNPKSSSQQWQPDGHIRERRRRQTQSVNLPWFLHYDKVPLPYNIDDVIDEKDEDGTFHHHYYYYYKDDDDNTFHNTQYYLQSYRKLQSYQPPPTQQQQLQLQQHVQHSTLYSHAQSILDSPESIEARTCCASILNVFHEHCDRNEEVEYTDRSLFVIVSVIAMCSIVKSLIKHFEIRWLPEAAGCILVGLILGSIMEQVAPHIHYSFDGSLFLRVMLPFIVFHAALSIDKHALYLYLFPIALYAVVGTLVSSALVALFIYVGTGFGMPLVESCIFGALISSIDPIAVLSILQSLGMTTTDAIYVIIFGESLFNDGIAIVLYETLVEFLDETIVITSEEIIDSCIQFIVVILGSIGVGVLCGGFCTLYFYSMEGCQTPLVEVLIFLCWALIPYYICDGVSWSGIVGIVAAGIVMDLFVVGYHNTDQQQQQQKPQENGTSFVNNQITSPSLFHHHHRRNISTASGNTATTNINNTNTDLLCLCEVFRRIFTRKGHLSHMARNHVGFVAEINATLMETAIFAYLGLFLLSSRYKWNLYLTALAILSCLVSRAAMIPSMTFIANRISSSSSKAAAARSATATTSITSTIGRKLLSCLRNKKYTAVTLSPNSSIDDSFVDDDYPRISSSSLSSSSSQDRTAATTSPIIDQRMQIVLWFGGLRGAMSFALVENIPLYDASTGYGSRLKPELKAMTSASIIFTVFICGGTTFYLLERLGMSAFSSQDAEMIELTSPLTTPKRSNNTNIGISGNTATTLTLMDQQQQQQQLVHAEKASPIAAVVVHGSGSDIVSSRTMGSKVRHRS